MVDGPWGSARTLPRRAIAVAAVLALGAVVQLGPARAETVEGPATISREAYFTNPITQVTPPLLRNGFPPATACLVAGLVGVPQVCGTEIQQLAALLGLSDGLPIPVTPDSDLAQPIVVPGTTPVGMLGGQQRYASLVALGIPTLPDGERFASFELVLHQDGLNFALESPALRDVVLQIVAQLEAQDPQKIADAVTRAITGEVPLVGQTVTGIEACPITEPWNAGPAQGAGLDGVRLPDTDCLVGTTGAFDPATATWTFDLTFAVQAWTEGADGQVLENNGIMLRPVGAPNFAYGDPDLSTNWVVSLADSSAANTALRPMVRYSTVPTDSTAPIDLGPSVDVPSLTPGGPVDFGVPSSPVSPTPDVGGGGGGVVRAASAWGHTPGWVWIALPLGLLASMIFAQALDASPAVLRRRPGALTRLSEPGAEP
ncbi:MAG TPA: hypothetical protein VJ804_09095 [Acidimicrobiales bacterium]|nr:hypothetical protein [Acidimicrobiales bacterium]